jgi:hypothetical protein
MIESIRQAEKLAEDKRNALIRAENRRQEQIEVSNRRMAIKLFTQKSTIDAFELEKGYKVQKRHAKRLSRFVK